MSNVSRANKDDYPYFNRTDGCWYCISVSDANDVFSKHPGAMVMLYDRDEKTGKMINVRPYKLEEEFRRRNVKHGHFVRE